MDEYEFNLLQKGKWFRVGKVVPGLTGERARSQHPIELHGDSYELDVEERFTISHNKSLRLQIRSLTLD
jgi:hypothetical protein